MRSKQAIEPIRMRPHVYREAKVIKEGSKQDKVKTNGEN